MSGISKKFKNFVIVLIGYLGFKYSIKFDFLNTLYGSSLLFIY